MKFNKPNNHLSSGKAQSEGSINSIMVVDDSKFARNILCDILRSDGFNVVAEAKNGVEAVEMAREKKPKYIFLDVEMPMMDGLGAIPKILEVDSGVHIIMCTAMGQKNIIVEAVKAGAKDYVIKPYKKENILRVLNLIIESKKKGEKAESDNLSEDESTGDEIIEDEITKDKITEDKITDVGFTEVGITEDGDTEDGTTEVGITEAEITEAGITEVGITEVGNTENVITEVGVPDGKISEHETVTNSSCFNQTKYITEVLEEKNIAVEQNPDNEELLLDGQQREEEQPAVLAMEESLESLAPCIEAEDIEAGNADSLEMEIDPEPMISQEVLNLLFTDIETEESFIGGEVGGAAAEDAGMKESAAAAGEGEEANQTLEVEEINQTSEDEEISQASEKDVAATELMEEAVAATELMEEDVAAT